jgi:inosine-uridine nucleoside N-ribohydrolase
MPRKIIIDCGPGHDDAMAILLAHGNPEVELCAITTVAGNQTLEKTTLNARRVCSVANITGVPWRPAATVPSSGRSSPPPRPTASPDSTARASKARRHPSSTPMRST